MAQGVSVNLQTILQAATEIVDSQGLKSLSLTSVAHMLSIRPPSLYNHIHGLSGLRTEIAIHGCDLLNSVIMRAALGKSGDHAVYAMAEAFLNFARIHPGLYDAVQEIHEYQDPRLQQAAERIVDTVVQVMRHYGLDEENSIHAVRGFRSLVHGFASLERSGGFRMPVDVDRSFHFLLDAFLTGLHTIYSV